MNPAAESLPLLNRSTKEWQQVFRQVYGLRNRMRSSALKILTRITIELSILAECVRKDDPDVERALAGVAARIFALANWFELDLERLVLNKYPGMCIKCGSDHDCSCLDNYDDDRPTLSAAIPVSIPLDDIQSMMRRIYGKTNETQGRARVFNHLFEENGELALAVIEGDFPSLEEEIADLFAWWIAYANLRGVTSLSELLFRFYPDVCSSCGKNPCPSNGPCQPL